MAKIFVRERSKIGIGDEKPRFAILAVHGIDLDFIARHARKQEIEAIAKETGAEVIYLKHEKRKTKLKRMKISVERNIETDNMCTQRRLIWL